MPEKTIISAKDISLAAILLTMMGGLLSFNTRITTNEGDIKVAKTSIEAQAKTTETQLKIIQDDVNRIETKLDTYFNNHQ